MEKKKLLITTANESSWMTDRPVIFLGEWCRLFSRRHKWKNLDSIVVQWHWANRDKFKKDSIYLNNLNETVLNHLYQKLNSFHKVRYSKRYWRIIVGGWLKNYISVLWDRWETIRYFGNLKIKCETIVPKSNYNILVPRDYSHASILMSKSDEWNYFIYTQILKYQNHKNINLVKKDILFKKENRLLITSKKTISYNLILMIDKIIRKLTNKHSYKCVFFRPYLSKQFLLKLFFKTKQTPTIYSDFELEISYNNQPKFIRPQFKKKLGSNIFEQFLFECLFRDMPKVYLEGYDKITKYCKSLPKSNLIYTANAHFSNEVFKTWTAEQINNDGKLILGNHGGGIKVRDDFRHEEKICDKKIVWHKEYDLKHNRLSPNKLIERNIKNKKGDQIILVGLEYSRYSNSFSYGPISSLIIKDFDQKINFIKMLNQKTKLNLRIRPYPDKEWSLKDRYVKLFGKKILSTKKKLLQEYEISKLIICTYPQTTFSEAMYSGVPTILLFTEKYWDFHPVFNDVIFELKKNKIIHTDSKKAAQHVNNISHNPEIWWNNSKTIKARKKYLYACCLVSDDPLLEWANYFNKMLGSKN
jgi:putative transferase (TIGR04331 family)